MSIFFKKALDKWQSILDKNSIKLSEQELLINRKSTMGDSFDTPCTLIPKNLKELSSCIAIAKKYSIKIFPVSAGYNHGYNSATPGRDGIVVINLNQLSQITNYNSEFGYLTIEPGVTFYQLYHFLAEKDSDYMMSGFTGNPKSSVMANALDRGTGKGVYGNRELSVFIKEVMLANGDVIDLTKRMTNDDVTRHLQYATTGLDINHLFYQSSLAIVTKMVVHLEPIPEVMTVGSITTKNDQNFLALVDHMRELNRQNIIKPTFGLINLTRILLSTGEKRPKFNIIENIKQMSEKHLKLNEGKLDQWNCAFSIYSSCDKEADLRCMLVDNKIKKIASNCSLTNIKKSDAKALIKNSINNNFTITPAQLKFLFNLGYTNEQEFKSLYWASNVNSPDARNPIEDGCGFIYFAPKIPFSAKHIKQTLQLLADVSNKHDRERPILFQVKTKDLAYLLFPIVFSTTNKIEAEKAKKYYQELVTAFEDKGYYQYRLNNIATNSYFYSDKKINQLLKKLKAVFDPNDIIASRYKLG